MNPSKQSERQREIAAWTLIAEAHQKALLMLEPDDRAYPGVMSLARLMNTLAEIPPVRAVESPLGRNGLEVVR